MKPVSLPRPSSLPRTDPAKRRHQLELPVPWGDGQWPMRGTVQGGLFLLPLQQGGCQGVGLCGPVPGHAGVHAEVPRPLPPGGRGGGGGGGEASRSLTGSSCLRGQRSQRGGGVELMMAGAPGSSRLQSPDEPLQESVFPSVVPCTVMYKISYCADRGSWPLPVYTEKWQSWGDVVGVCISHEPISECSCCF